MKQSPSAELIALMEDFEYKEVDYLKVYSIHQLEEIREIAKDKGGALLSDFYLGIFEKLEFECREGHRFKLAPTN